MNNAFFLMVQSQASLTAGYWVGGAIAILILAYLGYSLVKPEKF
jgi:K+-transporting ATPase KdpF subunit